MGGPEMMKQGVMTPAGLVPAYDQQQHLYVPHQQQQPGGMYLPGVLFGASSVDSGNGNYGDQSHGHNSENMPGKSRTGFPAVVQKSVFF
jgi:hypothetical protein